MSQATEIPALQLFPGDRITLGGWDWIIEFVAVAPDGPVTVKAAGTAGRPGRELQFGRDEVLKRSVA